MMVARKYILFLFASVMLFILPVIAFSYRYVRMEYHEHQISLAFASIRNHFEAETTYSLVNTYEESLDLDPNYLVLSVNAHMDPF